MTRFYKVSHTLLAGLAKFFFNVKVTGLENVPPEGKILICSNHVSATDGIAVCAALRGDTRCVMIAMKGDVLAITWSTTRRSGSPR